MTGIGPATGWHAGEQLLQARAGHMARLAEVGPRILRDHLPQQHRDFYPLLPTLMVGSIDTQGQPWASVVAGTPGFVQAPTDRLITVAANPLPHDPLQASLVPGAPLGLLGIQPHTGRRNRANGRVAWRDEPGFGVAVGQTFGNCPKYITRRAVQYRPVPVAAEPGVIHSDKLEAAMQALIGRADTLFIATSHPDAAVASDPAQGVDVSHRGGPPGFLRVEGERRLSLDDYPGNGFFNTFGNLALQPLCGLLLIDFVSGERLQLAATARVVWPAGAVTPRRLDLHVTQALHVTGGLPLCAQEPADTTQGATA